MPPLQTPVKVPLVTQPMGVWESLQTARRNVLEILPEITVKQPIVSGKTAIVKWHMVMDPKALRRMMLNELDNYPKSNVTKNILEPAIGDSLFIAEGAHWRWQRRAASPVFSHRNVQNLGPVMTRAAAKSVGRVRAASGQAVNLFDEMVQATFDVIADVTFSGDDAFDRDVAHDAIDRYIDSVARVSLFDIIGVPTWVPRPNRQFSNRILKDTKRIADEAVERRKAQGPRDIPDLLDLLLEGEDPETKRQMSTAELRDNLLTFIVAGHETTALTLSWALYLLGFDQGIQDKLRAEVDQVVKGDMATIEDVAQLKYTRMVIDETLRLYPPAGFLSRTAQAPDTLCDRPVEKGDTVMIPVYSLHRNELLWDAPSEFRPERFADPKSIDRYAYLPFGNGPRVCIGAQFALQEAVIILASLIKNFRFAPVPGKAPEPVMILTLRPEGGVWLNVEPL